MQPEFSANKRKKNQNPQTHHFLPSENNVVHGMPYDQWMTIFKANWPELFFAFQIAFTFHYWNCITVLNDATGIK